MFYEDYYEGFRDELTWEEKLEMKMGKSELGRKIQEATSMAYGLQNEIKKLERTCKFEKDKSRQMSKELGANRMQIESMKKHIKALEMENSALKKLALMNSKKVEAPTATSSVRDIKSGKRNDKKKVQNLGGKSALDVFPEKVWRAIFEHLEEPKDLKSCYDTCPAFQVILKDKRQIFLFSEVLPILASKLPVKERSSILKNCRSVCNDWKQRVDHFLQSEVLKFAPKSMMDQRPPHLALHFTAYKNPWTKALKAVDDEINPIPSRYLVYNEISTYVGLPPPQVPKERLRTDLISYLAMFGSHVSAFKVEFCDENTKSYTKFCYNFICEAISMMPNLKMLHICRPFRYSRYSMCNPLSDDWEDEQNRCSPSGRTKYLEEVIRSKACPKLPNLETAYFESCHDAMIHAVLEANPQVTKVEFKECFGRSGSVFELRLDKLCELSIFGPHNHHIPKNMTWKVGKLSLCNNGQMWENCEILFWNLEASFAANLQKLRLMIEISPRRSNTRLHLPNLKVLHLQLSYAEMNVDFILPLKNLEYLSVEFEGSIYRDNGIGIIRRLEHVKKLKKSNVWKLFPKLKKVRVRARKDGDTNPKWICCTRKEAGVN